VIFSAAALYLINNYNKTFIPKGHLLVRRKSKNMDKAGKDSTRYTKKR
jgi:hypothetical protein